jgi:hypothetical protein
MKIHKSKPAPGLNRELLLATGDLIAIEEGLLAVDKAADRVAASALRKESKDISQILSTTIFPLKTNEMAHAKPFKIA